MIWINDYLSLKINWLEILDQRTLNALNLNANIYTIKDLLIFCSNDYYESKLSTIKWIWLNWINRINDLLNYIKSLDIKLQEINKENQELIIDKTIYNSNLNLYSSYLSIRTVNALYGVWINNVWDLIKNKDITLKWVRWLWKAWLKEIDNFINYIISNFSWDNSECEVDYNVLDIIKDQRILQVLWFNWIQKISELEKFLESKERFQELRYANNNDYFELKKIYNDIFNKNNKISELTFADIFMAILNNLSEEEKIILNDRILWNNTLIEVWKKLWLTRERVRQKQKIIEKTIQDNSDLFIKQNPELLLKITNTIKIHSYIFLPHELSVFDYLWFTNENTNLLYLFLKWLKWLKWEIINNKIFCIFSDDIDLNSNELSNIYDYVLRRIKNNNDDIPLEDLFYELILDNWIEKNVIIYKDNRWRKNNDEDINLKNNIYEVIL